MAWTMLIGNYHIMDYVTIGVIKAGWCRYEKKIYLGLILGTEGFLGKVAKQLY